MADKKDKPATAAPGVNPKAVKIGGESLVDRIVPHIKKILVMVVVLAVVISAILVVRWRGEVKREKATSKMLEVLDVARRGVGEVPPELPNAPKKPKDEPKPFPTDKDRAEAVLAQIQQTGADPVGSFKGSMLLDAGKVDEAIAEYRGCQNATDLEGVLCREGLGIALEAKAVTEKDSAARQKLYEEALATYVAMQPDENGPRRVYALYHQGRVQQTLGKIPEAKALFEKAKPLAAAAEPETRDPRTDAQLLSAIIDRRLATM